MATYRLCLRKIFAVVLCSAWGVWVRAAPIHEAAEIGDVDAVQAAITEQRASVALRLGAEALTPLHIAAGFNHTEVMNLLLAAGADVHARSARGHTPLHRAAYMNAVRALEVLLAAGADVEAKTPDGETAFQLAVRENARDAAAYLMKTTRRGYAEAFLDAGFAEGEQARMSGDLARAYEIFSRLFKEDPENSQVNFALGLTAGSMGDYSRARLAFERVLQSSPGNHRARLELGRTLMQMKQWDLARAELESVLAQNPPFSVQRSVERFLGDIARAQKKWFWRLRFDAGVFYDDNVNVGPVSEVIQLAPEFAGLEWRLPESSQARDDIGVSGTVSGQMSYPLARSDAWSLLGEFMLYQSLLFEEDDYQTGYVQFSGGVGRTGSRSRFRGLAGYAHIWTGGDSLVHILSVEPSVSWVMRQSPNVRWTTQSSMQVRDYDQLNARDGFHASLTQRVQNYMGSRRHSVFMAAGLFYEDAESDVYSQNGMIWRIGGEYRITAAVSMYGRVHYTKSNYKEREVLAPEDRSDTQYQYQAGGSIRLTSRWGMDLNYRQTSNQSTFGLYEYDRQVVTLSSNWSF